MSLEQDSSLTVAELLARGIDEVDASCGYCGHGWRAPIAFLPDATTLEKVSQLMACPACGRMDIDVEPVWPAGGVVH